MADNYAEITENGLISKHSTATSVGVEDAGRLVALDSTGALNSSLLPKNIVALASSSAIVSYRAISSFDYTQDASYTNPSSLPSMMSYLGVSISTAIPGQNFSIQQIGVIENTNWNLTPDLPLFVSELGILTQVQPVSGFSLVIGIAISSTQILLQKGTLIQKA